ncbi:RusA-like Holliday junction resolvase [Mycobacterium phage Sauce]|uniref:RusA-like resolvase n=2 Tax=Bixzunavirus TaxID=680114 RepID=A0A411CC04_9CAUD|nr:RusA-like Holliday junction resolvase [Mycobacterium phage QBert]YP_010058739.1 RusA-like Holliday junction resolvase [Mycobacterium phage Sauce]AYR01444.1 RusA-like resolvase [Mycobacterium phage Sauce]QAY11382.1 RusA-like resolvase [Mycobacterium phage QBert]
MEIDFFVPGLAAPQGSKNSYTIRNKAGKVVGVNTVEQNSKTLRPWRADVKVFAQKAMQERGQQICDDAIYLHCDFVMKRPSGTPKTRRTPPAVRKPDLDKLIRAIGDALKGTVYTEDSRIVEIRATKRIAEIGETPGVFIHVGVKDDDRVA